MSLFDNEKKDDKQGESEEDSPKNEQTDVENEEQTKDTSSRKELFDTFYKKYIFEPKAKRRKILCKNRLGDALAYIMKYIEKSGEKIVYSRGLAQFFMSDIMDEDIVCLYGMEEQKFLLYDDFGCWDEGEYIGQVSKETIAKMPKAN